MTPEAFIDLAERLASAPTSGAAEFRSAISRAYYGSYHLVRNLLEQLSIDCRKGGVSEHRTLIQFMQNCNLDEGMEIGHLLSNLHDTRKFADYELQNATAENRGAAKRAVIRAKDILSRMQVFSSVIYQQKLKAGITQYRKLIGRQQ